MTKLTKVCNVVAWILLLSFLLKLGRDWVVHDATLNSAPFTIWIIADSIEYLLPAGSVFLIGRLLKAAQEKKTQTDSDNVR